MSNATRATRKIGAFIGYGLRQGLDAAFDEFDAVPELPVRDAPLSYGADRAVIHPYAYLVYLPLVGFHWCAAQCAKKHDNHFVASAGDSADSVPGRAALDFPHLLDYPAVAAPVGCSCRVVRKIAPPRHRAER